MKLFLLIAFLIASITGYSDSKTDTTIVPKKTSGSVILGGNTVKLQTYVAGAWLDRLTILNDGNVGISTATPLTNLHLISNSSTTNGTLFITGELNKERIQIRSTATSAVTLLTAYGGTMAVPTATANGATFGYYQLGGYDGTDWIRAAWITGYADGLWSASNHGASLVFSTTPNGSTSITERMRIASDGKVGIGTTAPYYGLSVNSTTGINSYNGVAGLGKFVLGDPADPTGYVGMYRSASGPANVGTAGTSLGFGAYSDMTFSTGPSSFASQTERMRIQSDGKVAVWTTGPASNFSVGTGFTHTDTTERTIASFGSTDATVPGTSPSGLFIGYKGHATDTTLKETYLDAGTFGSGAKGKLILNRSLTVNSDGIKGNTNGVAAVSGNVGEMKSATTSALALTSYPPTEIVSLLLTDGNWSVSPSIFCGGGGATYAHQVMLTVKGVNNTSYGDDTSQATTTATHGNQITFPTRVVNVAPADGNKYIKIHSQAAGANATAYGAIKAIRLP